MQNQPCEQFFSFYKHLYSGKNKRHYILQYSAKILVAAAGFEPTTFGLWGIIVNILNLSNHIYLDEITAIFRGLYFSAFLSLPTVICSGIRFWGQFWGRKIRFKSHEYLSKIPIIFLFYLLPSLAHSRVNSDLSILHDWVYQNLSLKVLFPIFYPWLHTQLIYRLLYSLIIAVTTHSVSSSNIFSIATRSWYIKPDILLLASRFFLHYTLDQISLVL